MAVYFKGSLLELPSGTHLARLPEWQREPLQRIVDELNAKGILPAELGRPLGGGEWEVAVRGQGEYVTHRCRVEQDAPERRARTFAARPEYDTLYVRVPVDRWVEAPDFLKQVPRSEDCARLEAIFTRLLRGAPPPEAEQAADGEWDVRFPVKFAGMTLLRVRLGSNDPNWGRPGN